MNKGCVHLQTFVIGRHFSFLLSLTFPTSDEFVCVSFCTTPTSFCTAASVCWVSSVIFTFVNSWWLLEIQGTCITKRLIVQLRSGKYPKRTILLSAQETGPLCLRDYRSHLDPFVWKKKKKKNHPIYSNNFSWILRTRCNNTGLRHLRDNTRIAFTLNRFNSFQKRLMTF